VFDWREYIGKVYVGDCMDLMRAMPDGCVDAVVTSPPYNIGPKPDGDFRGITAWQDDLPMGEYEAWQVAILVELYRVTVAGGSLFYNHKTRTLKGQLWHPLRLLDQTPWWVRQEVIWDRCGSHNHEPSLFWPSDERVYWMTRPGCTVPSRNPGLQTIWRIPPQSSDHQAPFPETLVQKCLSMIKGDLVFDPFLGSGTTAAVCERLGRRWIGCELSPTYAALAEKRIARERDKLQFDFREGVPVTTPPLADEELPWE
jgi:DNA modification methylase